MSLGKARSSRGGGKPWNVWRLNESRDDWPTHRRPENVYTDRRNDGHPRRDSYDSYRPFEANESHPRQGNSIAVEENRRRASMHEPARPVMDARPSLNRNTSYEEPLRSIHRGSPLNSTDRPIVSAHSQPRVIKDQAATELRKDAAAGYSAQQTTDPRLKFSRCVTLPPSKSAFVTSERQSESLATPNMNLDGASDVASATPLSPASVSPSSPNVIMGEVAATEDDRESGFLQALIQFIELATASAIQSHRAKLLQSEVQKAKAEKDKMSPTKVPPPILEIYKSRYSDATKSYKLAYQEIKNLKQSQMSSGHALVDRVMTFISDSFVDQHETLRLAEEKENDSWQKSITARLQVVEKDLSNLQPTDEYLARRTLLEKNQRELKSLMEKAQPQFENGIKSLKQKQNTQNDDIEKLRRENTSLKNEMKDIKKEMQEMRAAFTDGLRQRVLQTEFESYKTTVLSTSSNQTQSSEQKDMVNAEIKTIRASLTGLRQTIENRLSQHVLKTDFDTLKSDLHIGQPVVEHDHDKGEGAEHLASGGKSEIQQMEEQVKNLLDEQFAGHAQRIANLENSRASLSSELQELQKMSSKLTTSVARTDLSSSETNTVHNPIQALSDQVEAMKTELRKVSITSSAPASKAIEIQELDRRLLNVEEWRRNEEVITQGISSQLKEESQKIKRLDMLRKSDAGNVAGLMSRVDKYHGTSVTKAQLAEISEKVEELSSRPATLSTKEKMLLNSLDSTPKRLNDMENTVLELVKKEESSMPKHQADEVKSSPVVLQDLNARLNTTQAIVDGLSDQIKRRAPVWDEGLKSLEKFFRENKTIMPLIEKTRNEVKACEHSLRSLTSRYNNISSEKLARQIAEITQPVPVQLRGEQANMKVQLADLENRLVGVVNLSETLKELVKDTHSPSETLEKVLEKVQDLFVETKDFAELQETIDKMNTRLSKVEEPPLSLEADESTTATEDLKNTLTELSGQFAKGRDDLQAHQQDHEHRLRRLEGRVAHVNDWPSDDPSDGEGETTAKQVNEALLRQFGSHSVPTALKAKKPSPNASATTSARNSPNPRKGQASSNGTGAASDMRPLSRESWQSKATQSKSSTPRTESPSSRSTAILRSLGDRASRPTIVAQGSTCGKRPAIVIDNDSENDTDVVVVRSPPVQNSPRKKGKKPRTR